MSAKYYQEHKERLQKKACERYQNLFKEEKKQYCHESYKTFSEDLKIKIVECRKKIITLDYNYRKVF